MNTQTSGTGTLALDSDLNESNHGVQIVPKDDSKERNRVQVQISMSESQVQATDKARKKSGMNRSEFIRWALSLVVDDFPDDLMAHGEALNNPPKD